MVLFIFSQIMMNINEVSKLTGISKDMIRFYEKKGLIQPERSDNNYRSYTVHDMHLLILIKQYNSLGIPLSSIRSMLLQQDTQTTTTQFKKQIEQLKKDAEWAYARYKNAEDLLNIINTYKSSNNYDTGIRKDFFYLNTKNITAQSISYVNSGIARAVYHISLDALQSTTYPEDTGLLFTENHPNDNYTYQRIPEHMFYRTIVEVSSNQIISTKQLNHIIQEMHTRGYQECGDIFIYQVLATGHTCETNVICVELVVKQIQSNK